MTDQKIIDNAPKGTVCIDANNDYFNADGVMWSNHCKRFDFHDRPEAPIRSLADIKRIVELEKALVAPTDSGVVELDKICEKFNSTSDYSLTNLVCLVWNKAFFEALKEQGE